MTRIKELADRVELLQEKLSKARTALAKAVGADHATILAGGRIHVDYIPDPAVKQTIHATNGKWFDAYMAEIDGAPIIHYTEYREEEHETIRD